MDHHSQVGDLETSSTAGGGGAVRDLFALTDEQILEIEPEAQGEATDGNAEQSGNGGAQQHLADHADRQTEQAARAAQGNSARQNTSANQTSSEQRTSSAAASATGSGAGSGTEPPRWLADMMADSQSGGEAREFWNGVEQARQDAAAYREVFAQPAAARAAAERVRVLDEIDGAYFAGDASARSRLAATMLREDPAAFREMVFEGLRALEEAEKQGGGARGASDSRLARAFGGANAAGGQTTSVATASPGPTMRVGGPHGETGVTGHHGKEEHDARMAAYATFEKSANEDLERSVGGAIDRTLQQALPNTGRTDNGALKSRLVGAVRQDVEKALQGDRQLGEQVAQLLSGKRLDSETRAQVVRLIGERAEQLVPGAAKRILNDWTQTTIAAHRERTERTASASTRQEIAPVSAANIAPGGSNAQGRQEHGSQSAASARGGTQRGVDYRKLSDEQILAL